MTIDERVAALPWTELGASLWDRGRVARGLPRSAECEAVAAGCGDDRAFRSRVDMAHRFGDEGGSVLRGAAAGARRRPSPRALYPALARVANPMGGGAQVGRAVLESSRPLQQCARAGQTRPTPLVLRYREWRVQLPPPGRIGAR